MSQDITQIVKTEVIDKIDNTVKVKEVIEIDDSYYILRLCNVKWLKTGRNVEDADGNFYTVNELDRETGIIKVIRPQDGEIHKRDILSIIVPKYVHGTRTTTNNEWLKSVQSDVRFGVPLIWLLETTNESERKKDDPVEFEGVLTLYFLDEIDVVDSLNDDQRDQGVRPMLELESAFMDALDESFKLERLSSAPRKTISRFGNEDQKGMIEMILDANLGGVESRPTITIYKNVGCKC